MKLPVNPRMQAARRGVWFLDLRPCDIECGQFACRDLHDEIAEHVLEGGVHVVFVPPAITHLCNCGTVNCSKSKRFIR